VLSVIGKYKEHALARTKSLAVAEPKRLLRRILRKVDVDRLPVDPDYSGVLTEYGGRV
jgi:hypothetical protein